MRTFEQELTALINRHCQENGSDTPDFILAQFMESCLRVFETAVQQRETWHGRDGRPRGPAGGRKEPNGYGGGAVPGAGDPGG